MILTSFPTPSLFLKISRNYTIVCIIITVRNKSGKLWGNYGESIDGNRRYSRYSPVKIWYLRTFEGTYDMFHVYGYSVRINSTSSENRTSPKFV